MPEYDPTTQEKIDDLELLSGGERKPAEIVIVYWPSPDGTKAYASADYINLPWWPDLADAIEAHFGDPIPLTITLIPDGRAPFRSLPRTASVSDDTINLTFSDKDDEFSGLMIDHGEGIRCEVFGYWPAVDLLLSQWRGSLHAAKENTRELVKLTATAGFRSPQLLLPRRPHAVSCPLIFGGLLLTQAEIDYHNGCLYNAHLTELQRGGAPKIGVEGFTDCPRRVVGDCFARMTLPDTETQTTRYWPSFETRPDPIANNQTQGPNLLAYSSGNESRLNEPIRALFGERYVKSLNLLASRNELNNNHPDEGFGAGLFEVGEGVMLALWDFRMMGELVGAEHQQHRLGEIGQSATGWSPNVNTYSGTAIIWGRILGDFTDAGAGDYSASVRALGLADIRVYTDATTFTRTFTRNRMWCLLECLANARWGYGQDYPRFDIEAAIEVADWCDEQITLTAPDGETFSGVRSTFNAELVGRATQQQIKDICTAGRIGLPFDFEGKDTFVALKAENTADPLIPVFTDEGANRNILYDGARSTLSWSQVSDSELTNQWTVNFDDAANGGVDTQLIFGDQAQQLKAGKAWGDRSVRVINKSQAAFGITNADEAARLGLSLLYLGPLDSGGIMNNLSVTFTTHYSQCFNVRNYALVKVLNTKLARYGFQYFRVMKYTREGDLQVKITAQAYATLEEAPHVPTCEVELLAPVVWETFNNSEETDDGELVRDGGTPDTNDSWAKSAFLVDGDSCARWEIRTFFDRPETNDEIYFVIEDEFGGANKYGWRLTNDEANFTRAPYQGITSPLPIYYGPEGVADENQVGYTVGFRFGIHYDNGTVTLYENTQHATNTDDLTGVSYVSDGLPTDRQWRLRIYTFKTTSVATPAVETSGSLTTGISAPRDFTALVNATTGQVQFSWSPPLVNPQLVEGYVIRQGAAVIMAEALVYNYETTLAPGNYTYRVRGEGAGVLVSPYAYVSFTVPTPPLDLGLIDRPTGNTLVDRTTGQTLESRA